MINKTTTQKTVEELNIIDDTFFHKMVEDIGFCEEMLSTVLQQKIIVESVIPQNSIKNLQGRSVILDAYCVLENGRKCNVEVQKENDDDHIRRVRYNAACLTANITSPGTHFKEVPDVIMIFVSKFDIFKAGKPIFKEQNAYDFENFPRTSERKRYFKEDEGGRREMCEIVENYAKEYAKEALKEKIVKKLEKGKSIDVIADELEESVEVIERIVNELQTMEK